MSVTEVPQDYADCSGITALHSAEDSLSFLNQRFKLKPQLVLANWQLPNCVRIPSNSDQSSIAAVAKTAVTY
ncbi:hypothetical protein M378DRAFT_167379 [Amanita muscaria Koide BX008]|uniref:Uncharacterized protein n=1 Tax=Amanita muscaria (strain Koide BX008) TaxID=946122 RepID=A0A0C2SDG9_AMAMK|nr:hypothetical protein M378DRAFT_167379 [Amanita muscaria Koide BX008]